MKTDYKMAKTLRTIAKVYEVNHEAGDYCMQGFIKATLDKPGCDFVHSDGVNGFFVWAETPQGDKFWSDIHDKIGEE